ncbi:MAG: NAD(P)H-dependent glycerol-3-phosphate dehydrogenase, partial [Sediminispirochaetaceae bacterium]
INSAYLLGVELPDSVSASTDIVHVADGKDFLILAVPSLYLIATIKHILMVSNILEGRTPIGILTKGFIDTGQMPLLPVEAVENYLPGSYRDNMVYISGPSHAEEVARGKITGLISASRNPKNSIRFRELLNGKNLLVFSSLDVIGVQTAAAIKNVIAIAFGMLDALKDISPLFGDNTESLLLAAGLSEIQQLGTALGSTHPETFTSIAAVGDLDVTCRSVYGRNRRFGREIIHERKIDQYRDLDDLIARIDTVGYLPEGAAACKYARIISQRKNLRTPVINAVYSILNHNSRPLETLSEMVGNIGTEG